MEMANDYGKPPFPARLFLCWVGGDAHGAHSFFLDFIYCSTVTVLRLSAESIEDRCKGVKYGWLFSEIVDADELHFGAHRAYR